MLTHEHGHVFENVPADKSQRTYKIKQHILGKLSDCHANYFYLRNEVESVLLFLPESYFKQVSELLLKYGVCVTFATLENERLCSRLLLSFQVG